MEPTEKRRTSVRYAHKVRERAVWMAPELVRELALPGRDWLECGEDRPHCGDATRLGEASGAGSWLAGGTDQCGAGGDQARP
jgi:hypothetical protein